MTGVMIMSFDNIHFKTSERTTDIVVKNGVTYLTYRIFDGLPVKAAVSTRLGGVSEGYVGTMNMSTTRGDDPKAVEENHRLFSDAVGYDSKRLVMSDQIHETTVIRVYEEDAGAGVLRRGVDGLMTDVKKLPLMTFYADCVPLMIYDTKNHVIAMSHSGWRGTVARIGEITLKRMKEEYGTDPIDVRVAIGPSICQDCYEVDKTLLDAFYESFSEASRDWFKPSVNEDHFMLDLQSACRYTLIRAGVKKENIAMPDLCTCCNPDFLFSHRASHGKRGNLSVVMELM